MEQFIHQVAHNVEKQLDSEIERLDALETSDLEAIRARRLADMKKKAQQRQEWLAKGHGEYSELCTEKEFFAACAASENLACHVYRRGSPHCDILDMHLRALAAKHVECRFVKMDAEKAPFLTERLKIRVIPTLILVKDNKTRDFVVGFTDLGNREDFHTDMLEWRIARSEVIEYNGDLLTPPTVARKSLLQLGNSHSTRRNVRGPAGGAADDEDFSD